MAGLTAYASQRLGLAYLPIPRAGSTSVKAALLEAEGLGPSGDGDSVEDYHHAARALAVDLESALRDPGLVVFTVVRNPYSRAVSAWRGRVLDPPRPHSMLLTHHGFRAGMTFPEFVGALAAVGVGCDPHVAPQEGTASVVERTLRFETLADGWERMTGRPLPALNASAGGGDWAAEYDDRTREVVGKLYRADLWMLGYSFGPRIRASLPSASSTRTT